MTHTMLLSPKYGSTYTYLPNCTAMTHDALFVNVKPSKISMELSLPSLVSPEFSIIHYSFFLATLLLVAECNFQLLLTYMYNYIHSIHKSHLYHIRLQRIYIRAIPIKTKFNTILLKLVTPLDNRGT